MMSKATRGSWCRSLCRAALSTLANTRLRLFLPSSVQNHSGPLPIRRSTRLLLPVTALGIIIGLALFSATFSSATEKDPPEARVKAAFLLNFPKYVEWPANALPATNSPYVIATFGESEVAEEFSRMARHRPIAGHPVEFRILKQEEECGRGDIHILFIPESEHRRLGALLEQAGKGNTLTVGESDDFIARGGIVNLARKDRRIRLQVSVTNARKAQLKISSKLLNVADVVEPKN